MSDLKAKIDHVIAEMRPYVQNDGGDLELSRIESDDVIRVRLSGACLHCAMAGQTLGAVRRKLVEAVGRPIRVLPEVLE